MGETKNLQDNREILYRLLAMHPLENDQVYKQSCLLDELIVQYMKKQISPQEI